MNIDKDLYDDIVKYCEYNNKDIELEINKMIKIGFSIIKYGNSPFEKIKEQMMIDKQDESINHINELSNESEDNLQKTEVIKNKIPKRSIRVIKNK